MFRSPWMAQTLTHGYLSQISAMPCSGGEEVSGLGSALALGCFEAAAC